MCTKNEAEQIIQESLSIERLKKIILKTSIVAWNNQVSDKMINRWLENFTGKFFSSKEIEHKVALWLLAHFTFYSINDVRILCKNLFNLILHQKLVENRNVKSFDEVLNELIYDSLFVGLGNNSESGNTILYYFRQENKLSKKCFEPEDGRMYKNLIFIDDVAMSGTQACSYGKKFIIDAEKKYAGFLIATEESIKMIRESTLDMRPIATMVLDKRDRAFSENSFVFSDSKVKKIIEYAKEFCREYGKIAVQGDPYMSNCPLGYKDGAYLIGFEYNTPDNSLPIFWGTGNGWIPIFKRYEKIYGTGKESAIDGRKYY